MALVAGGVRVVFWFSIIALAYLAALAAGHAWLRTMTCVIAWAVDHRTKTLYKEIARPAGQGMAPPARDFIN